MLEVDISRYYPAEGDCDVCKKRAAVFSIEVVEGMGLHPTVRSHRVCAGCLSDGVRVIVTGICSLKD